MRFAGGYLQTKQVQRFNIPAKEQGTRRAVVQARAQLCSWRGFCDSPTSQLPSPRPSMGKHCPPPPHRRGPQVFPGVHKLLCLQNCREHEGRMFIAVLVPLSYLSPLDPCARKGWREMVSVDASKPRSAPAVVTAPKTLLAAADLAVLEPLSTRGKGGSNPSPPRYHPAAGPCVLQGSWDSTKKQFLEKPFHSLSSEGTEEKGHPSNCTLLCRCPRLAQGQVCSWAGKIIQKSEADTQSDLGPTL